MTVQNGYYIEGQMKRDQKSEVINQIVAKVEFDIGIDSVRGILMGDDPYYIRRYPDKDGTATDLPLPNNRTASTSPSVTAPNATRSSSSVNGKTNSNCPSNN